MTTLQLQRPVVSSSREMLAQQELARVWAVYLSDATLLRLAGPDIAILTALGPANKAAVIQELRSRNLQIPKS